MTSLLGRLTPPPRPVPLSLRAAALGGSGFTLGTLVFAPLLMVSCFIAGPSLRELTFLAAGPFEMMRGTVTGAEDTRWSQGGRSGSTGVSGVPIRRIRYRFVDAGGLTRDGVSFRRGLAPNPGSAVDVEVSARWPRFNRIAGDRVSPLGLTAFMVTLFPLAGLYLLVKGIREVRRFDRLLAHGDVAAGRIVSREVKTVAPDKKTGAPRKVHVDYEFEFTSRDGRRVAVKDVTSRHLDDMATRTEGTVLYDPARPESAIFLEALPRQPEIGSDAHWRPAGAWPTIKLALLGAAHASYVVAASWVYFTEQ